jgi:hypothetical protein
MSNFFFTCCSFSLGRVARFILFFFSPYFRFFPPYMLQIFRSSIPRCAVRHLISLLYPAGRQDPFLPVFCNQPDFFTHDSYVICFRFHMDFLQNSLSVIPSRFFLKHISWPSDTRPLSDISFFFMTFVYILHICAVNVSICLVTT